MQDNAKNSKTPVFSRKYLIEKTINLRNRIDTNGKINIYIWAVVVGILAGVVAKLFHIATTFIGYILFDSDGHGMVSGFMAVSPLRRVFSLTVGGLVSGLILYYIFKKIKTKAPAYMEVVAIGNGYIPSKANLWRSLAAIVTIGSGASIGREGPLVQTATVVASYLGRKFQLSVPRLRLLVSCSAAGAMSAVFHTPLAGAIFVCEIVIGVFTIEMLAPMLVASCTSFFMVSILASGSPVYEVIDMTFSKDLYLPVYSIFLAIIASVGANIWLTSLSKMRSICSGKPVFTPLKLALAGLIVGLISMYYPEVAGNGAHLIRGITTASFTFEDLLILAILKFIAVGLFFAMGAVGGVLTPSLAMGCILGFLYASMLSYFGFNISESDFIALSLISMAAFFTTAAAAPITSLLLVIEFTMAGQLIFPLIIAVVVSYGVSRLFNVKSMYESDATKATKQAYTKSLKDITIKDLFVKPVDTVYSDSKFGDIASKFIKIPYSEIFVISRKGKYFGAILQRDIISFLKSSDISDSVLAVDVMHTNVPKLSLDMKLIDAIKTFIDNDNYDSLPIVGDDKMLKGVVNKSDLFMGFNEITALNKLK